MAGTIIADAWKNGDGTENYKVRALCNFDGTSTVTIKESKNISSLVDNGTGLYSLNFINNMATDLYTVSATRYSDRSTSISTANVDSTVPPTIAGVSLVSRRDNTLNDPNSMYVIITQ